jgi:hypothetical protein
VRGAALLAALAAAAFLPAGPPGIGVPIVGSLVAATVLFRAKRSLDLVLFGSLALGLAAMAALLDAGWVVAIDLTASLLLATIAVGGVRVTAPIAPIVGLSALPALVPLPGRRFSPALRGVFAGGLLVVPFGALFWTGDAAFAAVGRSVPLPGLSALPAQAVTFALVLVGTLGLTVAAQLRLAAPQVEVPKRPFLEWAVPLGALGALFLAFVAVQTRVLFGGNGYVLRTTGLTYADYARRGFWQLIAAAALTLVVISAAVVFARIRTKAERRVLHSLLGALSLLTLLTVASALYRLRLYEGAFGLSRLRLFAEAFSVWLGALFVLLLAAGVSPAVGRQLARIALAMTAVGLLAFSAVNPDRLIARRNVERWRETGRLDLGYLQALSADAVPVVASLPEPIRSRALGPIAARFAGSEPWSSANLSRHHARTLFTRDPDR